MTSRQIILASSSPYRRELLSQLRLPFNSSSPKIDESRHDGESAYDMVERLSVAKACVIAKEVTNALVIGSDQVAVLDGKIVGKPVDHNDAVSQLKRASGHTIKLYTGLALVDSDRERIQSCVETYHVEMRELDEATIERYLSTEKPYNCCGSLRAEGLGIVLLKKLSGDDPNTLIGLPLIALVDMLQKEGIYLPA